MLSIKIKSIKKLKKRVDVYDIKDVKDNNNFIANGMVVHNCDLFARGRGACFVKDKNPAQESWRIKDFTHIGNYNEFTNKAQIENILKRHPNFWTIIKFPKPPDWLYTRYLKVREKNVYDDDNVMANVSKEDIYNALLVLALRDIMMQDDVINMNRLVLHIKNEYDIPISKGMIQAAIEDAKQLVLKVRDSAIQVN